MKNGQTWLDVDGNPIQAHGGCILLHEGIYYWYGEHKGIDNCPGTLRVDVIGISCYSSTNLRDWKYHGLALAADRENEKSPIHPSCVLERPKVIFNAKTQKFVMLAHVDSADYTKASVGFAVSDTPVGPFTLVSVKRPNKQDSRDMTVFVDTDGTAYVFHSKDWNKTMNIARLTEDYLDFDGMYVSVLQDQEREAPAVCMHKGMYYMVTSGCTGWSPNAALYAVCPHIMGKWKLYDNPCEGKGARETFGAQSTFIFEAEGKQYLMLDHWIPHDLKNSGYTILPLTFEDGVRGVDRLTVRWQDEWNGLC
jgi:beta-xylosidase